MRTVEEELDKTYGIFSGGQLQRAVIEIDSVLAPYVTAEVWHCDQTLRKQSDGAVVLEVPFASKVEIAGRILSMGSHAKVTAPESLKKYLADEIGRMSNVYGGAAPELQGGE